MRRMTLGLIAAAAVLGLIGCDGENHNEVIDGPYRVIAENQSEDMSICYQTAPKVCISRVGGTVFQFGFNHDYIVAARHPADGPSAYASADRSRTDYFYIIRADDSPDAGPRAIRGPLTKESFEREKVRLGLPPFSRELKIDWDKPAPAAPAPSPARGAPKQP